MAKMIYSDYLEEMVVSGFTVGETHYSWNEIDLVYWSDETDDDYYMEVPKSAILD